MLLSDGNYWSQYQFVGWKSESQEDKYGFQAIQMKSCEPEF